MSSSAFTGENSTLARRTPNVDHFLATWMFHSRRVFQWGQRWQQTWFSVWGNDGNGNGDEWRSTVVVDGDDAEDDADDDHDGDQEKVVTICLLVPFLSHFFVCLLLRFFVYHWRILFSFGAPLIPSGGSFCIFRKSRSKRLSALLDIVCGWNDISHHDFCCLA